jgi:hypothetical protein
MSTKAALSKALKGLTKREVTRRAKVVSTEAALSKAQKGSTKRDATRRATQEAKTHHTHPISRKLIEAAKRDPPLEAWSPSTTRRRVRVKKLWQQFRCLSGREATAGLFARTLLRAGLKTHTTLSYMATLATLRRCQRKPEWADVLRALRKRAATETEQRAQPATAEDVATFLRARTATGNTIVTMFVSASRHADLTHARLVRQWKTKHSRILMISFPRFKSDLFGRRCVHKCLQLPTAVANRVKRALQHKVPYRAVWKAAKKEQLTAHSFRRGASSILQQRFKPEEVILLTQHSTEVSKNTASLRRYLEPSCRSMESKHQRRLSMELGRLLLTKG